MTRHLESTPTTETDCGLCGRRILVALDSGLTARVDASALAPGAEMAVLLAGRRTYVHTFGRHLVYRTAARITSGRPRGALHAEHICPRRKP